jgi:hypothetical protein
MPLFFITCTIPLFPVLQILDLAAEEQRLIPWATPHQKAAVASVEIHPETKV